MTELDIIYERITTAVRPEEIFGAISGDSVGLQIKRLRKKFRQLSRYVHPDHHDNNPKATEGFALLNTLYNQAMTSIEVGVYGIENVVTVKTKHHEYRVYDRLGVSGLADVFMCVLEDGSQARFHVAQTPRDGDVIANEAVTLKRLLNDAQGAGFHSMLPELVESLVHKEGSIERKANVFAHKPGYVPLSRVLEVYPGGLPPQDMAWIWRRLLDILGYAHSKGIIHGAVTPSNVLIGLGDVHQVVLANWQNSIVQSDTEYIKVIDSQHRNFYPPEVFDKKGITFGVDICMSAKCMQAMTRKGTRIIDGFLMSCIIKPRPQNAWQVRQEFTDVIDQLWEREYRPLHLTNKG